MPPSRSHRGLSRTVRIVNAGNKTHVSQRRTVSHALVSKEGAASQARYQLDITGEHFIILCTFIHLIGPRTR